MIGAKYFKPGAAILVLLTIVACSNNMLFEEIQSLPVEGWHAEDSLNFTIPVSDTSEACNILLHVRNTKNYKYSNLWMFVTTQAPNGNTQHDTLELMLADETGRWLGKGTRSINTLLVPYMRNVKFPYRGIYTMTVEHAMRDTLLHNITDIGIRIEPEQ